MRKTDENWRREKSQCQTINLLNGLDGKLMEYIRFLEDFKLSSQFEDNIFST